MHTMQKLEMILNAVVRQKLEAAASSLLRGRGTGLHVQQLGQGLVLAGLQGAAPPAESVSQQDSRWQ
jgi:hypothetical protein